MPRRGRRGADINPGTIPSEMIELVDAFVALMSAKEVAPVLELACCSLKRVLLEEYSAFVLKYVPFPCRPHRIR